jgi:phosphate transport system permease protein
MLKQMNGSLLKTGVQPDAADRTAQVEDATKAPARRIKLRSSRFGDVSFRYLMLGCALSVLAIVVLIVRELLLRSSLSIHTFGLPFFVRQVWDPVNGDFGALPFIYGTLVSSGLALLLAVPLSVGVATFTTELCPRKLRAALSYMVELLAAIPSVIYGFWGVYFLIPFLRFYVQPFLAKYLGWTGLFGGPQLGMGMLAAGIILAIMIIPIITSITREVMSAVPTQQREGVLALGATRWEMIRVGVLRNSRTGILGAVILGLGRAIGETMAVTMLIGNRPEIARSLFAPGYSLASVIANEYAEATEDLHKSALAEIGLALFLITLVVNIVAQLMVWSITRGNTQRATA